MASALVPLPLHPSHLPFYASRKTNLDAWCGSTGFFTSPRTLRKMVKKSPSKAISAWLAIG
jgi:hypothetical protein